MASLPAELKADPAVAHALGVREAVNLGNYSRLFRLYRSCPNLGIYVMDGFVDRERKRALRTMLNAYASTVPCVHMYCSTPTPPPTPRPFIHVHI